MWIFKTVMTQDFLMFILGTFGMYFFLWLHKEIKKCNPSIFAAICTVLAYIGITLLSNIA